MAWTSRSVAPTVSSRAADCSVNAGARMNSTRFVIAQGVGQRGLSLHARPNVQHVGGGLVDQADSGVGLDDYDAVGHGRQHGFEAGVVVFEGPRFRLQGVGGVRNDSREVPDFRAAGAGERLGAFRGKQTLG